MNIYMPSGCEQFHRVPNSGAAAAPDDPPCGRLFILLCLFIYIYSCVYIYLSYCVYLFILSCYIIYVCLFMLYYSMICFFFPVCYVYCMLYYIFVFIYLFHSMICFSTFLFLFCCISFSCKEHILVDDLLKYEKGIFLHGNAVYYPVRESAFRKGGCSGNRV